MLASRNTKKPAANALDVTRRALPVVASVSRTASGTDLQFCVFLGFLGSLKEAAAVDDARVGGLPREAVVVAREAITEERAAESIACDTQTLAGAGLRPPPHSRRRAQLGRWLANAAQRRKQRRGRPQLTAEDDRRRWIARASPAVQKSAHSYSSRSR